MEQSLIINFFIIFLEEFYCLFYKPDESKTNLIQFVLDFELFKKKQYINIYLYYVRT